MGSKFRTARISSKVPPVCKSKQKPPPPVEACPQFFEGNTDWLVSYSGDIETIGFNFTVPFQIPDSGPTLAYVGYDRDIQIGDGFPIVVITQFEWQLNPDNCTFTCIATATIEFTGFYSVTIFQGHYGKGKPLNFQGYGATVVGGPGSFAVKGQGYTV